ncbi:SusD/RagB family nutrient-binding outer membrane lipoprotein [Adhaeribacter aquaticus]|uniref:SusD/RagB family nutrient-binding outer membrane lipoprotein n=1 Tax=Adhaeribacter aquaticus TaxID=299567 RepID=UPI000418E65A|nr:SusD/RagB family nutrient-binding outer membrane lipoprotein [Adhaeribacter aquaticus]
MKKKYLSMALVALLIGASSCDKDFEQINTNPNQATSLDPAYLLNSAQFGSARTTHHYEGEIIQQVNTPYTGILEGGNHNILNDVNTRTTFEQVYQGPIRNLTIILNNTASNPAQSNIYNMARILKAYNFMVLVDTYGDVPYFDAGKAFLENNYLPKYDPQAEIYADILKELEEATKALDASKPTVTGGDIFYNGNIPRWQKLGNSLLLRAGMRYTDVEGNNSATAKAAVAKAMAGPGGLMTSNDDNAMVRYNAPAYVHATTQQLLATERANFFAGEPFVNFMKAHNDPRAPYIFVRYSAPGDPNGGTINTNLADQFGLPYGYSDVTIRTAPGFRGSLNEYSYFRRNTVLEQSTPEFLVTYAQTQLLLADAAARGIIAGGLAQAKTHYETGIRAHINQLRLYNTTVIPQIPEAEIVAYLAQPGNPTSSDPIQRVGVLFSTDPAKALEQINTQYWVASFRNWSEAWSNFRRTEFPRLQPINYPGQDPSVGATGFIRRLPYPNREVSVNAANVQAAVARMGANTLGTRIFWDK